MRAEKSEVTRSIHCSIRTVSRAADPNMHKFGSSSLRGIDPKHTCVGCNGKGLADSRAADADGNAFLMLISAWPLSGKLFGDLHEVMVALGVVRNQAHVLVCGQGNTVNAWENETWMRQTNQAGDRWHTGVESITNAPPGTQSKGAGGTRSN